MVFLRSLLFAGLFAAAIGFRCHVVNNSASLHCGDANGMKCSSVLFTPYCEKILGNTSNMNGLCTCEKWCFVDSDCSGGCRHTYKSVCREAYSGSQEKVCLCAPSSIVG